jgi:GT2 family glycosyltransferase
MDVETPISVLIVSYNTRDLLRKCLNAAVEELRHLGGEIIVIDNASHDSSPTMVRREFPGVRLIQNQHNRGFAAANNQGLAVAKGQYICLLNSDATLSPLSLSEMVLFLEMHPTAGIVGPKLVLPDGTSQVGAAGYQLGVRTAFNHSFFLSRLFPHVRACRGYTLYQDSVAPPYVEVDWVSGACLMVRREAVEAAGPLNESFFMYVEDLEWCDRIRQSGWGIYYLRDVEVIHYEGASRKTTGDHHDPYWLISLDGYCRHKYGDSKTALIHGVLAGGFLLRLGVHQMRTLLAHDATCASQARAMKAYLVTSLRLMAQGSLAHTVNR